MARMARLVVPGYPHHVTQRGNRGQRTFFERSDYRKYLELIAKARRSADAAVWAYCLMPNHAHLIVVPGREDSLQQLFAEAHRQYTRTINFRYGWRGHLWQERFYSCVMDEPHLLAAVRYVELNPVEAKICRCPEDWPWSSARAHFAQRNDLLVEVRPMLDLAGDWRTYLRAASSGTKLCSLRTHSRTGRPVGSDEFIDELERITGRSLKCKKPGRKKIE